VEAVAALLAGGGEERGQDGRDVGSRDVGTEPRAGAAGDLAVDDGGAEILLGGVVGGPDVRPVEEAEPVGAVRAEAGLQPAGVGGVRLVGQAGPADEAVDGVLAAPTPAGERWRREGVAAGVQVDGSAGWLGWMARPNRWRSSMARTRPA
jgi:hypothetical protein